MINRFLTNIVVLLVILLLIFTASCAKKEVKSETALTPATTAKEETEAIRLAEEKTRQVAQEEQLLLEERLQEETRQRTEREELAVRNRFVSEDIHFGFDSPRLLPEAKRILQNKVEWFTAHPDVAVIIEGHCDERGINEYNMALGDRRAVSAKSFLVDLGIAPERLTTVSYGKERPIDPGHNEEAWARNRRVHFVID